MARDTGQLLEDHSLVCEAAERVVGSGGGFAEDGLEVTRTEEGGYEVRHKGLLVFRCLRGHQPDVFTPGEWVVRLVQSVRSGDAGS